MGETDIKTPSMKEKRFIQPKSASKTTKQGKDFPHHFRLINSITLFLARRIRISDMLSWDRKSFLTYHCILDRVVIKLYQIDVR